MPVFDLGYKASSHLSRRAGYNGTSLQKFFSAFPDDEACLEYLFNTRFGPNPRCPRCGNRNRWKRHAVQRHYFHPCGGILSPTADTLFARTKVPLQLWFYALLCFADSPESVGGSFLERQLGITQPTAFRMGWRIRAHMAAIDIDAPLGSPGTPVMAHLFKVRRIVNNLRNVQNSAIIFALSDGTMVNSTVVIKPTQKKLRQIINQKVTVHRNIITTCYYTHRILKNYSSGKEISEYHPTYFLDNPEKNDDLHGFIQYFRKSFFDQFRGVSLANAWLYFKEYEFRYNRRKRSHETFNDLISSFPLFSSENMARWKARSFVDELSERRGAPVAK
jgi:hypothetical protein